MHPRLNALIERFRCAQDFGVAIITGVLGPTLGVGLPTSGRDWLRICGETGLYNVRWINGIEVYTHGYGIELDIDGFNIDFDWGENGEPDGFDWWRLWNFARNNPDGTPLPEDADVRQWLEEAFAAGELTRDRNLFYSPRHRAMVFA